MGVVPRCAVLSSDKAIRLLAAVGRDWAFRDAADPVVDIVVEVPDAVPVDTRPVQELVRPVRG